MGFWDPEVMGMDGKPLTRAMLNVFLEQASARPAPHVHILTDSQVQRGGGICAGCGAWVEVPKE